MFEQSSYNAEPAATPTSEGDLFHDYEVKTWEFSPRLYKIVAAAGVANLFALLIFAQTSLLTMKGCDSPLVGRVCEVLDVVYIASNLFGTERDYIDAVYERTELGVDEEVTFVDVSGDTPPLSYPDGYFQIANPLEYQAMLDAQNSTMFSGDMSGFPTGIPYTYPSTGGSIIDTEPVIPRANPNVIDGDLPSFGGSSRAASRPRTRRPRRPIPAPTLPVIDDLGDDIAENKGDDKTPAPSPGQSPQPSPSPTGDEATEDKFGVYINKRPLVDRANETVAKVDAKEVKLDAPFKVTIVGTLALGKDGKTMILKDPKPVPEPGVRNDPKMEKLVQDWILAVGDAGWLGYLDVISTKQKGKAKKITVTVEQNNESLQARILSEAASENEAKTLASSLGVLLTGAAMAVDGDELVFLKAASTTSQGKSLVLSLNLPKPIVQEMIQRKLAATKSQPGRPNGVTGTAAQSTSAQ